MSRVRPIPKSFNYAFDGVKEAIKSEPNFRVHIIVGGTVLVVGLLLHLTKVEFIILLLTVSSVLILELVNTAIEALVDLASPKIHPKAKIAKDVAAAAVLGSAIMAIAVGAILFIPKIISILGL